MLRSNRIGPSETDTVVGTDRKDHARAQERERERRRASKNASMASTIDVRISFGFEPRRSVRFDRVFLFVRGISHRIQFEHRVVFFFLRLRVRFSTKKKISQVEREDPVWIRHTRATKRWSPARTKNATHSDALFFFFFSFLLVRKESSFGERFVFFLFCFAKRRRTRRIGMPSIKVRFVSFLDASEVRKSL